MDELNEIMTDTVTDDLEEVCPKIEHVKKKPSLERQKIAKSRETIENPKRSSRG